MESKKTGRTFRSFSLANLLWVVTIAGLGFALVMTYRQISLMQPELESLRAVARPLVITDPKKPHIVSLPTGDAMTWRWRVYVPKGYRYPMGMEAKKVPEIGVPASAGVTWGMFSLPEGEECILNATFRVEGKTGWVKFVVMQNGIATNTVSMGLGITPEVFRSMGILKSEDVETEYPDMQIEMAGLHGTEIYEPNEPIVLIRIRPKVDDWTKIDSETGSFSQFFQNKKNPTDGLLLWLTPIPNAPLPQTPASPSKMNSQPNPFDE